MFVCDFSVHLNITIEGYLDSISSLAFNTIKIKLDIHAVHSSRYLQSRVMFNLIVLCPKIVLVLEYMILAAIYIIIQGYYFIYCNKCSFSLLTINSVSCFYMIKKKETKLFVLQQMS